MTPFICLNAGYPARSRHASAGLGDYGLVEVSSTPAGSGAILRNPLGSEALVFAINGRSSDITAAVLFDLSQETWWLPPGHYELILRYIADDKREGNHTVDSPFGGSTLWRKHA